MSTAEQAQVPELRFREFAENWREESLGSIATFKKGKGVSKKDIEPNGATPCVRYGELYTDYGLVIDEPLSATNVNPSELILSRGGEVIVPASGEDSKDIATAVVVLRAGIALGGDLNIIESSMNGYFLAAYLSGKRRNALARMAQGNSVVHLYSAQLSQTALSIPSLTEQKKIADFLGAVDGKLAALREKEAALTRFKRGLMQALFSQTLRFTRDDGSPYPDWEEKQLGEVFERRIAKNDENNTNVMTISAQQGLINQEEYFNKSVSAKDVTGYYLLQRGDFAYNKSYSKGYPMGAIKRLNRYENGVVSTLYICFRPKSAQSAAFYEQYFESSFMNRELAKIAQEGARNHGLLNMSVVEFFRDIEIPYPHPEEQQKVSESLAAMDAKINAVTNQVTQLTAFKKGLLQQMFV